VLIRQMFGGVLDPSATDGPVRDLAERILA
jgi:hypothetical protein